MLTMKQSAILMAINLSRLQLERAKSKLKICGKELETLRAKQLEQPYKLRR